MKLPPEIANQKVVLLGRKPPVANLDGSTWKSALDMLKELMNDIEHGRIEAPDMVYVAMHSTTPDKKMYKLPSYVWAEGQDDIHARLKMVGLLDLHKALVRGRGGL